MTNIGTIRDVDGGVARVEDRKQTPTGSALNVQVGPGEYRYSLILNTIRFTKAKHTKRLMHNQDWERQR